MRFCQFCTDLVRRNKKATRWVAFFIGLSLFFTLLGWISDPVSSSIGLCRVYP